jgi:murein DD-endopeptidase MepM/ murein hydrolase activator NlpD
VRIEHADGYCTIYGHMMDFLAAKDQIVNPGDPIGRSDNTGNSTGPHLHFELRLNNKAIDPQPLLVNKVEELEGGTPEPPPPDGKEPKKWPVLPKVRVVSSTGLNVRSGPGVTNSPVGYLPLGTVVEVLRKTSQGPDTWLQIGHKQYIALVVAGEPLAVWVKA